MLELEKIEKNIYFDNSWIKRISDYELRRVDGKMVSKEDVKRLKKEKGIHVEKITGRDALVPLTIIHIDAFDEKNEAAFYFSQGIVHEMAGNFKRAEEQLLAAMEAGYEEKEVRYQLASLYYKMGRSTEAEQLLDKLKKFLKEINKDETKKSIAFRSPNEIEFRIHHRLRNHSNDILPILHDHFLEELEKGKLDESIKILERALDINEWSFIINHNIALLYFDTGELEKAEIFCARALWLRREHPGCHDLMGNIYFYQKVYEKALSEFKRMLEIDEWNAYAYYNLGSVYSVLDDWSAAEHHWKKAIECDKKKLKIGDEKRFTEKGLEYSLIVKIKSITCLSHRALGNLYSRKGMIDKAIDEFEKVLEIKPQGAEPYLDLAILYHKKKENVMVTAYLRRYLYLGGEREKEARKLLDQIKKEIH